MAEFPYLSPYLRVSTNLQACERLGILCSLFRKSVGAMQGRWESCWRLKLNGQRALTEALFPLLFEPVEFSNFYGTETK